MATLQIRSKGTSTVLFDLTDATGAANPHGLKSGIVAFDAGGNTKELGWFSPSNRDGDLLVYSRNGRRALGLSLSVEGASGDFDSLRSGVEALIAILEDGTDKEIYWVADTDVRYLDFQTADISRVLTGDHLGSVLAFTSGKIIGFPLTIYCDPTERGPELDPDDEALVNNSLLKDVNGDGVPDGWSATGTPLNPAIITAEECFEFQADAVGEGYLQDNAASAGQIWKVSVAARVASGTRDGRLRLTFRDATTELASVLATTTSTTFTALEATSAAAPAGTVIAHVLLTAGSSGSGTGTLRFRAAQLERVS